MLPATPRYEIAQDFRHAGGGGTRGQGAVPGRHLPRPEGSD